MFLHTCCDRNVLAHALPIGLVAAAILICCAVDPVLAQTDATSEKQPASAAPKQANSDKPAMDDRKRFQPYGYVVHEHEATVSGKVVDDEGQPIAGARVFVIPVIPNGVAYGKRRIYGEGKSGADGRYRLEKLRFDVLEFAPQAVPKPTQSLFQVFAIAEGYGLAWRKPHVFRPEKRPPEANEPAKTADFQDVFFEGETIEVDVQLSPEVRLHGIITDDQATPLKDVVVQVGLVGSDRERFGAPPRTWSGTYNEDSIRSSDGQFNGYLVLPEEFRQARTDADGRYEMRGIPRDCTLLTYIDYLPEYEPWSARIRTSTTPTKEEVFVSHDGELNRTLVRPFRLTTNVVDPDGRPVPNVIVRQDGVRRIRRAGSLDRTNDKGIATLFPYPGSLKLIVEPAIAVPYLPQELTVELKEQPREGTVEITLEPAAQVILEAVEQGTGKPVSGIVFLSEAVGSGARKPVESSPSFVDHPTSDESGRLRTVFTPGERRFFVDQRRSSYKFECVSPTTEPIDLTADQPTTVRFEFVRRPEREDEPEQLEPLRDELKPLKELLQKQAEIYTQMGRARFTVRRNNYLVADLNRAQVKEMLDSFESKTVEECLDVIRTMFPDYQGFSKTVFTTDGNRRREDSTHNDEVRINVFNGQETIITMGSGSQLDIYGSDNAMVGFLDRHNFWDGPANPRALQMRKLGSGRDDAKRSIRLEHGICTIDLASSQYSLQRKIDASTGFELLIQVNDQETRRYFPTLLPNGVAYPKLVVRAYYNQEKLSRCELTVIDKIEVFDRLPPDTFVVSAPPGTHIIDYRGIPQNELFGAGRRPRSGVVSAAVPDVIANRNRFAPAPEPVLKVGDKAPELKLETWVDAKGKATVPSIAGKVVLIDFWGISCGPCVAQLPEVNTAAKHFADSNLLILGVHSSGDSSETVIEFAAKKELVFPSAIDAVDPSRGSFGATFRAFGIIGIPTSVVINKDGTVSYMGEFKQAIEVAHRLAQEK